MNDNNTYAITIGRTFGSGGRTLGKMIADRLGIAFYDKELLLDAARAAGISPEFFEKNDERMPKFISGVLSFNMGVNPMSWYAGASSISDDSLYQAQCDFINSVVDKGPCVIVGRTADYVLRHRERVVNIFVHAPMDRCVDLIMKRGDAADRHEARRMAERHNKLRANYYNFYTDKRWGDASSYDLTVDSSTLPFDAVADLVTAYVKQRLDLSDHYIKD